jgi:hypothetical protein
MTSLSVVELNGQAVACVVAMPSANGDAIPEWTDEKNNRRCDLIDKRSSKVSSYFPQVIAKSSNKKR